MIGGELDALIGTLAERYAEIPSGNRTFSFNILDDVHLNENAHTRILVKLLQHPEICRSFLCALGESFSDSGLQKLVKDSGEEIPKASCFSENVDLRIRLKDVSVLVENKVKDAVDQDAQIDRYVEAEENKNGGKELTFVVYLTKDGKKKVLNASFTRTRELLGYRSEENYGRFLTANYHDHIVPWLKNQILAWAKENGEAMLAAGVAQYIDYMEGPMLLDCRSKKDATFDKREAVKEILQDKELHFVDCVRLASRLTQIRYQRICDAVCYWNDTSRFDSLFDFEKCEAIQRFFYAILGTALPEGELYRVYHVKSGHSDVASFNLGAWQDTSLRQVGVWRAEGTDIEMYQKWYDDILPVMEAACCVSKFKSDGSSMVRCFLNDLSGTLKILEVLRSHEQDKETCPMWNIAEPSEVAHCGDRLIAHAAETLFEDVTLVLQSLFSDEGALVIESARWRSLNTDFGPVDSSYSWRGGWAIQLVEDFKGRSFVRSIDFFPRRGVEPTVEFMKEIIQLSVRYSYRTYRWEGRICFSFPVVEQVEAIKLCEELNKICKR
jgi:hypothetical protein